jgi:hypothetical protein
MVEQGPVSYKQALLTDEATEWQEAVDSESASVLENRVLEHVDVLPLGKQAIPTKQVHTTKSNTLGVPIHYQARLAALVFRQVPGVADRERFSPIAGLSTNRLLFSIATATD